MSCGDGSMCAEALWIGLPTYQRTKRRSSEWVVVNRLFRNWILEFHKVEWTARNGPWSTPKISRVSCWNTTWSITQGMLHCPLADVPQMMSTLNDCFVDVSGWCASKRLQSNTDKTELLLFGTTTNLKTIPLGSDVTQAGSSAYKSPDVVQDLGVMLDAQLSMREQVSRTAPACFFHPRRLCSVPQQLGRGVTIKLVVALVFSRLDYCNAVIAGLPATTLAPLPRVLHAAALLVNGLRPCNHVTSILQELQWLSIAQCRDYRLCLQMHKSVIGNAPIYLTNLLTAVTDVPSRSALRDASNSDFVVPKTRLKLGERAFSVAVPLTWNRLPSLFETMWSTTAFKRGLKTFIYRTAYIDQSFLLCFYSHFF
jgi:hypothetical protein